MTSGRVGIGVGQTILGEIAADGADVAAAGDLVAPQLVVPISVRLNNRPREGAVALVELRARLLMPLPNRLPIVLGSTDRRWLGGPSGLLTSFETGSLEQTILLEFPLHGASLRPLEKAAATTAGRDVELRLELEASMAWLGRTWNNVPPNPDAPHVPDIERLGLVSELRFIHGTNVGPLPVYVPRERWAETVLPGLGLDRTRLVAVRLPVEDTLPEKRLVQRFDAARRAFDAGRFEECIRDCRKVREIVQRRLTGQRDGGVAGALMKRRGLGEDAPQFAFVDQAWKALVSITNAAVHDDPDQPAVSFSAGDARSCLLLTAILLEQLADELDVRP